MQTVNQGRNSNFETTKTTSATNQKQIEKSQQFSTFNKNNRKQPLQQKEKNSATKGSLKFNFKNNSIRQDKQTNKGKKTLQTEPQQQQNGLSKTSAVKLKNSSNVNKNTKTLKDFKPEKTALQETIPQAQKSKKQLTSKIQNKSETFAKYKSSAANGFSSNKPKKNNRSKKRKATPETTKQQSVINKKQKLNKTSKTLNIKDKLLNQHDSSSSEQENTYHIKNMKGLVRGGDYDDSEEDDMVDEYWLNQYNSDEDNEDSESSENCSKIELLEHTLPYSEGEEEEENYNSDSNDDKNYSHSSENSNKIELLEHTLPYSDGEEQEENYDSDSNDDENYSHSSENCSKIELIEHTLPYSDGEEEEDYDSDSNDDENYFNYADEEEEQRYSDFDEDDYEEEEDSYDYSMDSEEDYSSDYDTTYDFNDDDHDHDYTLPKHIPEDLIIHKGTATKRDIKPEDNVSFNSDHEEPQIVEIQEQEIVKVIKQPKAYDKEELIKLKYSEKTTFLQNSSDTSALKASGGKSDTKECPRLVPIVDKDGFQLYNPNEEDEDESEEYEDYEDQNESVNENEDHDEIDDVSMGSEYMEINSDGADSLLSEDINDKYLNRGDDFSESDNEIDENVWARKLKGDVIDATNCKYIDKTEKNINMESEESLNDNIKQLPSVKLYKNVDLKTASTISSATIVDKKVSKQTLKSDETDHNNISNKELPKHVKDTVGNENTNGSVVEEDTTCENSQKDRVRPSNTQNLINYDTKFYNAFDSNLVMVLLKDPFYVYGTVRITLLAGHVEVYGHTLSVDKEVEIFSPRGCSFIEITSTPISKISSKLDLKNTLKNYEKHFALADLKTICDLYDCENDAVVLLKRNETRKKIVQQFKKFMNENAFPNINNINVERPLYNTEYVLRCIINTSNQEQKCLRIPQQWQQLKITSQSRVMVTGGKSVGKSTLLRYIINRHLPQQILLIDLDIGQPEVFIPQTVSCIVVKQPLLGPGFMLNLEPDLSFAVGHTNIALCAHKYIEAVRNLIAYCMKEEKYQQLPWIINTMGYNKGFGLELISVIAKEFTNLTDLIQLQSSKEINNFDAVLYPHVVKSVPRYMFATEDHSESSNLVDIKDYRLHVWQSAVQQESRYLKEWEMSAKDLRFATLLTRLSQALEGHADWLTDCKPFSAHLDKLIIVNLMDNTPLATTEELAKSLEANLVYLCHYQETNKSLKCLGIGVIRAIDFHIRQLYLLPAVPHSLLKHVNCLALGEMCLPTSIFTNQGPRIKKTAAFVYNTIEANASKAIKQIYHRPRRFLTGKHKSLD